MTVIGRDEIVHFFGSDSNEVRVDRVEYCPEATRGDNPRLLCGALGSLKLFQHHVTWEGNNGFVGMDKTVEAIFQTAVAAHLHRTGLVVPWTKRTAGTFANMIPIGRLNDKVRLLLSVAFTAWRNNNLMFECAGIIEPGQRVVFHSTGHSIVIAEDEVRTSSGDEGWTSKGM